jgi:hypothetical protein
MAVKFYSFGKLVGGINDNGIATIPAEASYGPGQMFTDALPIGDTTITFDHPTKSVQVICTHDINGFQISGDGVTWVTLAAYGQISGNISVSSIILRATADSSYTVIAVLTE